MRFLKAKIYDNCNDLYDGKTQLFNLDQVLTIQRHKDGKTAQILMGPGLYWSVYTDSIEFVECPNELMEALR